MLQMLLLKKVVGHKPASLSMMNGYLQHNNLSTIDNYLQELFQYRLIHDQIISVI